jgi:ElaB/YqjD/DUF883 family membrane-anchored ribosome-binding protein
MPIGQKTLKERLEDIVDSVAFTTGKDAKDAAAKAKAKAEEKKKARAKQRAEKKKKVVKK